MNKESLVEDESDNARGHPMLSPLIPIPPSAEWIRRGSTFSSDEIRDLFGPTSPLLRDNSYALGLPRNTLRALQSDWRGFLRFCDRNQFSPLPASAAVVTRFIEEAYGAEANRAVSTV